jgi:hypothetical protein
VLPSVMREQRRRTAVIVEKLLVLVVRVRV